MERNFMKSQIKQLEINIALKKKLGKDSSFEEKLLKSWKGYCEPREQAPNATKRSVAHQGGH